MRGEDLPQPRSEHKPPRHTRVADSDTGLSLHARLGALLICTQALNFLLGARNQRVRDRILELNPWSMESKAYRVVKVRH